MTIRTKLILWYSGLLAFIIILFGVTVYAYMRWTLIASIDQTLSETATQVVSNSRAFPVGEFTSPSNVSVELPPLDTFQRGLLYLQVWNTAGETPLKAAASDNINDLDAPLDPDALNLSGSLFRNVTLGNAQLRVLTRPIELPGGQVIVKVQVAESLETVNQAMDRLLTIMGLGMTLAVAGSVAVGTYISNQALKPIDNLTRAAARITETDNLSTRLPWQGPMDELGRLTFVFNRMMERLEHLFGVQQRFVADVSHELRTPLTAIQGNMELIERYGADAMSIEAVSSEVNRMTRLVNDLLLLARADYGGMEIDLSPIDLDAVLISVLHETKMIVQARESDIEVKTGRFEPLRINGNADRLKQLLLNLVSNAVKFTPDGGSITLSLSEEGQYAVMRVTDTGIGIPESQLPFVFDRFYQVESSRANTEIDSGTGLGLSICKWIAEAHNGTIRVDSQPGQGTTFTIAIPKSEHTDPTHQRSVTPEVQEAYQRMKDTQSKHHSPQ